MQDFPNIKPDAVSWGCVANSAAFTSDLSGTHQVIALPGSAWAGSVTFTNRMGADVRRLKAFILSLQGMAGRFTMTPPDMDQQGSMLGAGRVSGAGQSGLTLNTNNWTANQARLFAAGDYIGVGGYTYMITEDVGSTGTGTAILKLSRPLITSPANSSTINKAPKIKMMITDDNQAQWRLSAAFVHALTISVAEDLL